MASVDADLKQEQRRGKCVKCWVWAVICECKIKQKPIIKYKSEYLNYRLFITRNTAFWIYCTWKMCVLQNDYLLSIWRKIDDMFPPVVQNPPEIGDILSLAVALLGRLPFSLMAKSHIQLFSVHEPAVGVCEHDVVLWSQYGRRYTIVPASQTTPKWNGLKPQDFSHYSVVGCVQSDGSSAPRGVV